MKISEQQELELKAGASILEGSPWGEECPCCKRPHVFEYSDKSKVCDKCDEIVFVGSAIKTYYDIESNFSKGLDDGIHRN